jgi:type I restriction enzyme S subunit
MKQAKIIPQLRFSGFDDDWEEKKLGEISSKVSNKNTNNSITETFTNSAEFGIISQRDFFDHDISNEENIDGYFIVENDDFVYNPRISTIAPVGPINRNKLGRSGVMSPLYYVFRTHDIDKSFLEKYFKSECWYDFMFLNGNSGARSDRFSITDSVFTQMPVRVPRNKLEQQKIGTFLSHVDSLIQAKTKKLESLKAVKKSLLQKCFPKAGEKVPEMRFAEFSGDWEEKKLGDLIVEINERTSNFSNYELFSLTIENGVTKKTERYERSFLVTKEEDLFKIVHTNNFVTNPMNFRFGAIGYSKEVKDISVSGYYDVFSIENNTSSNFWYYYFKTDSSLKRFDDVATGSLIEKRRVKLSTLKQMSFICPSKDEKIKIGQFFSKYDSLISSQQKEINKLKDIKKSLLQKMFI